MKMSMIMSGVLSALLAALAATAGAAGVDDELREVIITATPLPVERYAGFQPASVLNGDALQRRVGVSLGETLASQVGVSSNFFGPIANRPVIRGLGGYRVQMLGDGLTSMDIANLSEDHAVSLEPALSRQIEVLRGPSALLYGSGASGGVVNVVSDRLQSAVSAPGFAGLLDVRGDAALRERALAGRVGAKQGVWRWHADALSRRTGNYETPEGRVANSGSESLSAALAGGYTGTRGGVNVALSRFESEYGLPVEEEAFIRLRQSRLDLKGEFALATPWFDTLQWRAGATDYGHTEFEAPGERGTRFDNEEIDLRVTLERRRLGNVRAVAGLQVSRQDFVAVGDEAFVPPSLSKTVGVFGLVERPWGAAKVAISGRVDWQSVEPEDLPVASDYDDSAVSVALGLVWPLAASAEVAASLTRTQRHPQATELFAAGPHLALGRFEIGDASLRRESVVNLDIAIRASNEARRWSVGGFVGRYQDYIFVVPTGEFDEGEEMDALPIFAYGQSDAELYGFEAEVSSLLGRVGGGELRVEGFADVVRGRFRSGGDLPAIPAYRLGVGVAWQREQWYFGADYVHHGKQTRIADYESPTNGFGLLSVEGQYRWQLADSSLSAYLRGSNLLDDEARQHASPLKDQLLLPGRSLRLGVRWAWGD